MENYNRQTSDRFKEYDERMKTTRQKCKERCDKEIQKIILKDKLEKELMDKFATLHTDIQSDAIPTCVCEKSVADKVEKTCLKCGGVLGGGVAPAWGLISGIVYTGWKAAALAAATKEAIAEAAAKGAAAGAEVGKDAVIAQLKGFGVFTLDSQPLVSYFTTTPFNEASIIAQALHNKYVDICHLRFTGAVPGPAINMRDPICDWVWNKVIPNVQVSGEFSLPDAIKEYVQPFVSQAKITADAAAKTATERATATLTDLKTGVVQTTYMGYQTPIIASIVAIVVIVLIMVIIYLILRYRRKKKMKKKLQYIKLLEE
ncbi:hypothetical protein PFFCH_01768 [Plasmodium falciparum FCH/4]|uniref:Surface antigen n=1 Tax=Plasmodium falciparum FCH/4 TaxID=1036724 RepID=A0A024VQP7_PLAFA|nr:hypothetical protein PFFCH_01768 [Plasmodium falciparum FCH/4]